MQLLAQSVQQSLRNLATPEFIDDLLVGLNALHEHLYMDHELELINALDGGGDDVSVLQLSHDCIYSHLNAVCALHRLKLNPEARLRQVAYLVRALLLMQQWDDKDTILGICDSDAADVDRLAALVAIVGELSELDAQEIIADIDPNFLRGLKLLYTTDAFSAEEPPAMQVPPEQLTKLRAWRKLMNAERTLGFRMLKSGYQPGAALAEYLRRVIDSILERENKDIASELLPFILMSRDGWENPIQAWRDISQTLSLEARDITLIDVEILKLLGEFNRLNKDGVAK